MSLEIHVLSSLPKERQYEIADHVSDYTNGLLDGRPQMLPVSPDELLKKQLACVALKDKHFAGVVAASQPEEHNTHQMPEVGTLWVPQEYRKQKIAARLVGIATMELWLHDQLPYAFCNPLSLSLFKKMGYRIAGGDDMPAGVFGPCAKCPMKPKAGCCDTPVVYRGDTL